jgi:Na+/H+-dicarboxylate symporter
MEQPGTPRHSTNAPTDAAARSRLTRNILLGMALGAATGIAVNLLGRSLGTEHPAFAFVLSFGIDGICQFLGQGFLRLLSVLVVPLVLLSLICGTAALEDVRKVGRIGLRALVFYLATTAIAISLAMGAAFLLKPGSGFNLTTDAEFTVREAPPIVDTFIALIPRNAIAAMAEGQMLQIIFFAILAGLAISLSAEPGRRILSFLEDANTVVLRLVTIVMALAPFGVFGLIARTFATEGFDAFGPLLRYFFVVLGVLLLHGIGTYSILLWSFARLNPALFFRKMREVHLFAFSTASSNATIPVTLTTVENRLGVSNPIASFTIPLGATINMDGTAIMQGVATVFIAQAFGIQLGITDFFTVILTATLASIGTAGVPGVGLIMLGMVLSQVGLPVEGIALIIGIDRLLDMVRTAVNVTGDATIACIVAKKENELDEQVFSRSFPETSD